MTWSSQQVFLKINYVINNIKNKFFSKDAAMSNYIHFDYELLKYSTLHSINLLLLRYLFSDQNSKSLISEINYWIE
jgi:hypothetical protein